jgi:signal transduction histidine kinase
MNTKLPHAWVRGIALLLVGAVSGLALTCAVTSLRWVHATFPGFFVLGNRVVASVSLPHWSVTQHPEIFQHAVIAVNGQAVTNPEEIYLIVSQLPPGSAITYTLDKQGRYSQFTLQSQIFRWRDYVLLFGTSLVTGLVTAFLGIGVWFLKPNDLASRALALGSFSIGLFSLTVLDLYAPYRFFRLHAFGEALFPLAFIHFSVIFPVDRFRRFRSVLLWLSPLIALVLIGAYQIVLYSPVAYSAVHNLCMIGVGIGTVVFLSAVAWDYWTTTSHLVRQRIRVILIGFLAGFAFPASLMFVSGVLGGAIAVNYAAFTASLFPLSIGYAIVKHDLFEIDAFLKRGTYYLLLTVTLTLSYIVFLALLDFTLRSSEMVSSSFFPLLFTLVVVFFINPLKDFLQQAIDRVFFRLRYDPQKVLDATSASLAATLRLDDILAHIWRTLCDTLGVSRGGIFLVAAEGAQYAGSHPAAVAAQTIAATHPLIGMLQRHSRLLSFYDIADSSLSEARLQDCLRELERMQAQLLVPLILKGELLGFFALGAKESGAFFSAADRDFLSTFANQSALSIANARSYAAIEELNEGLEQKVEERTRELEKTNSELQTSLAQLEHTYRTLQRSQDSLLRAEKMAALGRLTAGIAHEMNTPLGASLSSLKIVKDLVREYQVSITDPRVTEEDHWQIAMEMEKLIHVTQQWMEKAAAHIRSLKLHTRDLKSGEAKPFSVVQAVEDTGLLLAHRFRQAECTLKVTCAAKSPLVYGDPGKLGQVLTNLLANAIDAYGSVRDRVKTIEVVIEEDGNFVLIRVRDQGCGIAPEHVGKIFDDFFSTKPLGEGTGLGLSLSRDIVTNFFAGTIAVESALGRGSMFTLRLPRTRLDGRAQVVNSSLAPTVTAPTAETLTSS